MFVVLIVFLLSLSTPFCYSLVGWSFGSVMVNRFKALHMLHMETSRYMRAYSTLI